MKIGVLGSTGFLGHHIYTKLSVQSDAQVVGGSRRLGVDARHVNSLIDWIEDNKLTHVINLAAECGGIGLNRSNPFKLWLATTKITAAVLEAAKVTNLQKVCMVGTVCSYSHSSPVPFKEDDLMGYGKPESTNAAYGVAKLNGLFGCQAYRSEFGLNAIYLLPVNLYGPNDNFDASSSHVIPALIKKIIDARESNSPFVEVWGTGSASREFLFVDDAADGIIAATKKYDDADPVNIGSGMEITIRDLAVTICELCDYSGELKWDSTKPDGQPRRCLDVTRAHDRFGFVAKTPFRDGLRQTIDWYLKSRR